MSKKKKTKAPIYQIKITLKYSKPPIWRRVLVSSSSTLGDLHQIIQAVMGWWDSHLHEFVVGDAHYGMPMPEISFDIADEEDITLAEAAPQEGAKFFYNYDFGDGWEHEILVEKILPPDFTQALPICVKGARACPPEDVGGISGYEFFLEVIQDPTHEEYASYEEWVGGDFDPEAFDLAEANKALRGD